VLAGKAGRARLGDAVVVEVVGNYHAAAPPEEGDHEFREAIELVDRGREPEVHAGEWKKNLTSPVMARGSG
jgi:hypothetical protein